MRVNLILSKALPVVRNDITCWTFVGQFEPKVKIVAGDYLSVRLDLGGRGDHKQLIDSEVVDGNVADRFVEWVRITACGDTIAFGEYVHEIAAPDNILPPLTCLTCMDALGDLGIPVYENWLNTRPIKIDLKV